MYFVIVPFFWKHQTIATMPMPWIIIGSISLFTDCNLIKDSNSNFHERKNPSLFWSFLSWYVCIYENNIFISKYICTFLNYTITFLCYYIHCHLYPSHLLAYTLHFLLCIHHQLAFCWIFFQLFLNEQNENRERKKREMKSEKIVFGFLTYFVFTSDTHFISFHFTSLQLITPSCYRSFTPNLYIVFFLPCLVHCFTFATLS